MARRHGLSLGDPVRLSPDLTLPVSGVYSDYGNPSGQAIVSLRGLLGPLPGRAGHEFRDPRRSPDGPPRSPPA
jgi:putative ABC transport system permease protein